MNNIVQWNMQSWKSNFCELKKIIEENTPVCICLQETLLSENFDYPPSKYKMIQSKRIRGDGHDRGVAILTHESCHTKSIQLNTSLQAVALRVWLGRWYTICSLYLPHTSIG